MAKPKGNSEKVCNKNANGQNDVTQVLIEGAWQGWWAMGGGGYVRCLSNANV